jgi:leucyl-tRNA synthetase
MRFKITLPASLKAPGVEEAVRADANTDRYLAGAAIKKVIVVPGKIINIVF